MVAAFLKGFDDAEAEYQRQKAGSPTPPLPLKIFFEKGDHLIGLPSRLPTACVMKKMPLVSHENP